MTAETQKPAIIILGLGPGGRDDLTIQARAVLALAAQEES